MRSRAVVVAVAVATAALLGWAGCKKKSPEYKPPPSPHPVAIATPDAAQADAPTAADAATDADAAPKPPTATPLELRVLRYATLLAIDVWVYQLLDAYPGAPAGTVFETTRYQWRRSSWLPIEQQQVEVEATVAAIDRDPERLDADAPVRAYAELLAAALPKLRSLLEYYDQQRFIDDEFDRGRREAPEVQRTTAELAKLRGAMRGAATGAWRDLAARYPESPRGVSAEAWLACMSVADRALEKAKPDLLSRAVSACRRSLPALTQDSATAGFDSDVRTAASRLGDWVAQGTPTWHHGVGESLGKLTLRFTQLWPQLPATPAERRAP